MGTLAHSRNVSVHVLQVFDLCQVFSISKPEQKKMGLNQIKETKNFAPEYSQYCKLS